MTYIQVSFTSKVDFFSKLETRSGDYAQTLRPAFLVIIFIISDSHSIRTYTGKYKYKINKKVSI